MGKLCGTLFVFNGNKFDYCFKEAIQCLLEFCDYVVVAAGGDDGTLEDILSMNEFDINKFTLSSPSVKSWSSDNMKVIEITQEEWDSQHGKEKLAYFTNIAIQTADKLGFEYQFNLQADEILSERSYTEVRLAVQGGAESYFCKRINLWQSPYLQLDVPHNRKPCSTEIVRLAKTRYRSVDDAESLGVPVIDTYFMNGIHIWHYGFVRKKEVMKSKIINMQESVFGVDHDKKLDECDVFNSKLWFDGDDLKPIDYPHPKIMKEWIKTRP